MTIENLVEKYIGSVQHVFQQIQHSNHLDVKAERILDYGKRYFADAIYYCDHKRFETALVSIAYCEGLLDALRLLKMVKFNWNMKRK